jgi:hypothetical protein
MGLFIGPLLAGTALFFPTVRQVWRETLRAYAVTLGITAAFSLLGLALGTLFLANPERVPPQPGEGLSLGWIEEVTDTRAFYRAGWMHNFSYLGGICGTFGARFWMLYRLRRQRVADGKQ